MEQITVGDIFDYLDNLENEKLTNEFEKEIIIYKIMNTFNLDITDAKKLVQTWKKTKLK